MKAMFKANVYPNRFFGKLLQRFLSYCIMAVISLPLIPTKLLVSLRMNIRSVLGILTKIHEDSFISFQKQSVKPGIN